MSQSAPVLTSLVCSSNVSDSQSHRRHLYNNATKGILGELKCIASRVRDYRFPRQTCYLCRKCAFDIEKITNYKREITVLEEKICALLETRSRLLLQCSPGIKPYTFTHFLKLISTSENKYKSISYKFFFLKQGYTKMY